MSKSRSQALTIKCQNISLSLTYDGLTIYPNYDGYEIRNSIGFALNECCEWIFGKFSERKPKYKVHLDTVDVGVTKIGEALNVQRYVQRHEDDHDLYHRDAFPMEDVHYHLKFSAPVTRDQLQQMLNIFMRYYLVSDQESAAIIHDFDTRFSLLHDILARRLSGKQHDDLTVIITFIRTCQQNDILVNLHQYLSSMQFDYLRHQLDSPDDEGWVGVDASEHVVRTARCWARIEKAITLQMAHNIQTQCSVFSPALAYERAQQLANNHRFFSIKHKANHTIPLMSSTFMAFSAADEETLDGKYHKMFGR